jgi:glycerol-3-phosphate O-acyltransferase
MLRNYKPETDRDIVFIPVGINYDRTIEDRSQLRSLDATAPKRSKWFVMMTTLRFIRRSLILMIMNRWQRFGYACVNFGAPISMRQYCYSHQVDFSRMERSLRFQKVAKLADQVMAAIKKAIPILPISLVSTVIRADDRKGLSASEVESQTSRLIQALRSQGAPLYFTSDSRVETIINALNMLRLRRLVMETDGLYQAVVEEDDMLAYYANSIVHWLPEGQKSR